MKFSKFIKKSIGILFIIVCSYLFIMNVAYINNINNKEISKIRPYSFNQFVLSMGIIVLILLICYFVKKIINTRKKQGIIIGIAIGIYVIMSFIWINKSITIPYADSRQIMAISKVFAGMGELDIFSRNYLAYYPQQITLSAAFSWIFRICGSVNYKIIEYLNVIANVFTILGLYFLTVHFSKKHEINRFVFCCLTLTFIPLFFLSTFVYGDFIGLAFTIWGVCFAIKFRNNKKKRYGVLSAVMLSVACLFRMNYIIFAIAIILYFIIGFCEEKQVDIKKLLIEITIIISYVTIIMVPSKVIKSVYTSKYDITSEKAFSSTAYLYMGTCEGDRGFGWYNNEMGDRVFHMMSDSVEDSKKISKQCAEEYTARLKFFIDDPIYTFEFYNKKILSMWAEPTMELFFYNHFVERDKNIEEYRLSKMLTNDKVKNAVKVYQKAITMMILGGAIIVMAKYKKDSDICLIELVFLGGFAFHILWEAKSRYIMPYYVILIPIATVGLSMVIDKLYKLINKVKKI